MTYQLTIRAAAEADVAQAAKWYEEQQKGLGLRFVAKVNEALAAVHRYPLTFHPIRRHTRRVLLNPFDYKLVYTVKASKISVVAVVHNARSPRVWKERLRER